MRNQITTHPNTTQIDADPARQLLSRALLSDVLSFEIHAEGSLVLDSVGAISPDMLEIVGRILNDAVLRDETIRLLKLLCGIQNPSPWWPQGDISRIHLELDGWREVVYLKVHNVPAVCTPTEQHGESIFIFMRIAPMLSPEATVAAILFIFPTATLWGVWASWGLTWGLGLLTLATLLIPLTHPRKVANRMFARAQELLFLTALLPMGIGLGFTLASCG